LDRNVLARLEELGATRVKLLLSTGGLPNEWHVAAMHWLGEKMSGDSEIKGLAQVINDEVTKLRDKARAVNSDLQTQLGEAHEALTYVEDLGAELKKAVNDLRGALGQHSNNPPPDRVKPGDA
jgi:hypothetical protein